MTDLDTVLLDLDVVEVASSKLGHAYKSSDVIDWGYKSFPEDMRMEIYRMFSDPDYMCNLKPYPGVVDKLKELVEAGNVISCITSRHADIKIQTRKMVRSLFPMIENIYFSNKTSFVNFNMTNLYVDDNHHEIKRMMEMGIKCVMISNDNTKYNFELRNSVKTISSFIEL